ncbi:MAG: hypothetical protein QMC23_06505 [Rubritalea sp.]
MKLIITAATALISTLMVSAAEIPNIVYLMSDDQNIDSMGATETRM